MCPGSLIGRARRQGGARTALDRTGTICYKVRGYQGFRPRTAEAWWETAASLLANRSNAAC